MSRIEYLFLALIFQVRICPAEIVIPTSNADKSESMVAEGVVKIVTSCYRDQINAVGLVGTLPNTLSRTLSAQHLIPVVLMDDTGYVPTGLRFVSHDVRHKLRIFIVGAASDRHLFDIILLIIMNSVWWDPMASFFILDQSPECSKTMSFLITPWQLELLDVNVMCHHSKHGGYIFTYNPFTSQAPVAWKQIQRTRLLYAHPFTMFRQKYQGNEAICASLDFVRTKDLGGHEIRVEGTARSLKYRNTTMSNLSKSLGVKARTLDTVFRALNVTPKFSGRIRLKFPEGVDMSIHYSKDSNATTYPFQQLGLVLVTKFRGHKTQLEKILYVIDFDSRIGVGIVYLITLIFLKFFVHQALWPAILNLVRITCNAGFTNLPDNTAPRMYLTGLLFFVVTLQGIYQGNLASLLTNKMPVRNVNSFKDIVDLGYTIYSTEPFITLIEESDLKERFILVKDDTQCGERLLTESSAACLTVAHGIILDQARLYDFHLSKTYVRQIRVGLHIRPYWFLTEQMNIILGKIMEADIFETWEAKCNPTKLDDFQLDKEVKSNSDFKVIELNELYFAFVILGVGLLCAIVTFIVEVAFYRYQQHKNNTVIVLYTGYNRDSSECGPLGGADRISENTHSSVVQGSPTNHSINESASGLSRTSIVTSALR